MLTPGLDCWVDMELRWRVRRSENPRSWFFCQQSLVRRKHVLHNFAISFTRAGWILIRMAQHAIDDGKICRPRSFEIRRVTIRSNSLADEWFFDHGEEKCLSARAKNSTFAL